MLMGKEVSCTSVARLYLVKNEQCAGIVAHGAQLAQKVIINHTDPGNTLDPLDYHCCKLHAGEPFANCRYIAKPDGHHIVCGIERSLYIRIVCDGYRPRRTPMKSFVKSQDFTSSGGKRCQLNSILISLRPRITQEQGITAITAHTSETISKLLGHRNIRTTQIYATITHSQLDGEMERLSKRINSLYRNLIPSDAPETGTKLI